MKVEDKSVIIARLLRARDELLASRRLAEGAALSGVDSVLETIDRQLAQLQETQDE